MNCTCLIIGSDDSNVYMIIMVEGKKEGVDDYIHECILILTINNMYIYGYVDLIILSDSQYKYIYV